jgi:hypothetical protein
MPRSAAPARRARDADAHSNVSDGDDYEVLDELLVVGSFPALAGERDTQLEDSCLALELSWARAAGAQRSTTLSSPPAATSSGKEAGVSDDGTAPLHPLQITQESTHTIVARARFSSGLAFTGRWVALPGNAAVVGLREVEAPARAPPAAASANGATNGGEGSSGRPTAPHQQRLWAPTLEARLRPNTNMAAEAGGSGIGGSTTGADSGQGATTTVLNGTGTPVAQIIFELDAVTTGAAPMPNGPAPVAAG